jgi:hypothetical protein
MTMKSSNQRGNVLFLILIAVALFAALSYAVTQSSRSGGDASRETNVINTASLTQYPNSVRTAVLRMIISGVAPEDIYFNRPDQFDVTNHKWFYDRPTRGVFHPQGGGAAYQNVAANLTRDVAALDWAFNMDFEVPLLGISQATSGNGNELIAFAVGVTEQICGRVNQELHADGMIPSLAASVTINNNRTATATAPTNPTTETVLTYNQTIGGETVNWFSNKAFGCFQNGSDVDDPYVFYYVMAER